MALIKKTPPPTAGKAASDDAQLLTTREAVKLLQVSAPTLERWRRTGDGPPYVRLSSNTIRYRAIELVAFIEGRMTRNTAEGRRQ